MSVKAKRVFISYAWESDEYCLWVRRLAVRLREDGLDARLDHWHLQGNDNIPEFMNREVRLADWVLVLCSPAYQSKVHATEDGERLSGVGWEARLLTSRLIVGSENKILAVLAQGSWKKAAPDFLAGQVYTDISNPATFEVNYRLLLQRITGTFEIAPPLGDLPSDLEAEPLEPLRGRLPEAGTPAQGSSDVELLFTVRASGLEGNWTVGLQVDGGEPVSAPLDLDLSPESQTGRELEAIDKNTCTIDDIQSLGSELWARLLNKDIEKEWDRVRRQFRAHEGGILKVRLSLPPQLEGLPWESVWDFDESSLATSPITSVVRVPMGEAPLALHRPVGDRPLRMLVVIPTGSGLRTSNEWEKIRQSVIAAGERVKLECLDGQVTLGRFAESLRRDWDIVHFIGHGKLDSQGRVELRLNREESKEVGSPDLGNEAWVSARLFAQQFLRSPAQLVVVNCCHGGSIDPQALSGLSGYLTRARVPATLVMRYTIHDSAAADFSAAFYRELFSGERSGRVDLAVQEGRATLERTYRDGDRARSLITPILYLAADCEQLFPPLEQERFPALSRGFQTFTVIDDRIDRKLLRAIEKGCCLPILGPGILAAGAERLKEVPPSPGGLAQRLAQMSAFPGFERITPLTESTADWLTPVIFERICQHFESASDGERNALNEAIQEAYRPFVPHEALDQIATWNLAGIVYTHVDGLLEQSLQRLRGRSLRVIQAEDLRDGTLSGNGELALLNLRGSYMAQSMVLTEEDEDRLLDRMHGVASFVADLMNRVGGCNLLFLGVSARDPLVRALARRLLREDVARNRGTAFFISDQATMADCAYWHQFKKLEWLELDIDTVIAGLTVAARIVARRPEDR